MKILFLIDSLPRGGKERRMIELLKGLLHNGRYQPAVAILSGKVQYEEIFSLGIPVHTFVRKFKKDPRLFLSIYQLCKRTMPDIIHSWGSMSSIYTVPAAKALGIKLINASVADAPLNLGLSNKKYLWAKLSFPFSDLIVGNSEAGLRAYRAPGSRSQCVYNGFDFNRIPEASSSEEARTRFHIEEGKIVGMVGAFHDRKDYPTYIKAAIQLLEEGRKVSFLAIGDGPHWEKCAAMVPPKFKNRIILPGLIRQVESVIQAFDIGVLATNSLVHGEGISNSILEYMAIGKPVVATDGGGTPEIVADGRTGFLVTPLAPKDMADKIAYLLDHPEKAQQMGEEGRRRIETEFAISRMTERYIEIYQDMAV
ncbi:MAG: glycosyltransferase [Lewinellaceae bacterium]|nr:glycosyltransferase [Phaeodactylibacter sp.]MCB0616025.1 glycosyltransferase [Phaeodactylibacter sp.]MCB9350383.1 glycosyltransferase [Lewinellaceae bacterium]